MNLTPLAILLNSHFSAHFQLRLIYQYIDQQNLNLSDISSNNMIITGLTLVLIITEPIRAQVVITMVPRIAGFCTHYESSRNFYGWIRTCGPYAVEIFMDYQTGIEQRLLVSAIQLDEEWEREFDAIAILLNLPSLRLNFQQLITFTITLTGKFITDMGYIVEQLTTMEPIIGMIIPIPTRISFHSAIAYYPI